MGRRKIRPGNTYTRGTIRNIGGYPPWHPNITFGSLIRKDIGFLHRAIGLLKIYAKHNTGHYMRIDQETLITIWGDLCFTPYGARKILMKLEYKRWVRMIYATTYDGVTIYDLYIVDLE